MTTSLHDRLADLADDAPPGGPQHDLWDRGRRYQRRRRAGTVVIAAVAVVVVVGLAGLAWVQTPRGVAPAEPGGELGLPDQLYLPSQWLPGTDETGPIGPVVALVQGQRGSDGSGIAGVSTTGEYTFLDLPDQTGEVTDVAVSPDGRWVAYWVTGDTSGEPNTSTRSDPVVGVGVYDTVTGETERYDVPTEHGLLADNLVWGGTTLWVEFLQFIKAGDDGGARLKKWELAGLAWDLDDGKQHAYTWQTMPATYDGTSDQDALLTIDGRRLVTSTFGAPGTKGPRFDVPVETRAVVDPTGGRIAVLEDTDDPEEATNQAEPVVMATPSSAGLTTVRVPGDPVDVLLGWRDEGHVVVQRYGEDDGAFLSLDVETGETEHLVGGAGAIVPQDVWQAPLFDAPPPPEPMSPGAKVGLVGAGVATVALAGTGVLLWRRRVRP